MGSLYTFNKSERLTDVRLIDAIFKRKGHSVFKPPVLLAYLETELNSPFPAQVLISVSKKKFNKAVDRNRIRRMMREAYRLHKHKLYEALEQKQKTIAIAFIYLDAKQPTYDLLEKNIILAIDECIKRLS
ncbi:ribonuclease P protein component [bacterium]|nr:ribonuclease P protein component [bacterium]